MRYKASTNKLNVKFPRLLSYKMMQKMNAMNMVKNFQWNVFHYLMNGVYLI